MLHTTNPVIKHKAGLLNLAEVIAAGTGLGLIRGPGRRIMPPGKTGPIAIALSDLSVIPPVTSTAARNDNARPLLQSAPASPLSALCQAG